MKCSSGPLEQSKPWNTRGFQGLWLFKSFTIFTLVMAMRVNISDEEPTKEEYKSAAYFNKESKI